MESSVLTKVAVVIENVTWEETQRMVLQNGELLLHLRAAPLDDCARRAMMAVGLPRPNMSETELAEFNRKQAAAVANATQCFARPTATVDSHS